MRVIFLIFLLLLAPLARAEGLSALARLDPARSLVSGGPEGVALDLAISQSVPWRVRLLDEPARLILDAREVDWKGLDQIAGRAQGIKSIRAGVFRPGWSRLVVELNGFWAIETAGMQTSDQGAMVGLRLTPTSEIEFASAAAQPEPEEWQLPDPAKLAPAPMRGDGPIIVVLDPGHGGLDPGAENDGHKEADLMLLFAREFKELLLRDGRFKVVLTRDEDAFVPLETRISLARAANAHIFLSLHADALAEGEAQGATIYKLSDEASGAAAEALAERHDRDDLLAGIDLSAQDDLVATVLMDMARRETNPRIDRLADALEAAIKEADLRMHRHAQQEAGFSVLKSPDIPSLLVELGFLSSNRDLKRLTDPKWRASMAEALRKGILAWAAEDQAIRALRD